jgi:hypothetical protein
VLPIGLRLRIALDVLADLTERVDYAFEPPTELTRMLLDYVQVGESGVARLQPAEGDDSGVAELVWAVLTGAPPPSSPPPRLRDVIDDIPTDVDELFAGTLDALPYRATARGLLEGLEEASVDYVAARSEVQAFVAEALAAGPKPLRRTISSHPPRPLGRPGRPSTPPPDPGPTPEEQ